MNLSKRIKQLQPSATLAAAEKSKKMKASGIDLIDLTVGEPDFKTPKTIQQAAIESIENGKASGYTAATGLQELKSAVIERTYQDHGFRYDESEVLIASGAKFALYALFQSILDQGDQVIVPAPYWVSYPSQIQLAEGEPVIVQTKIENSYKITVSDLQDLNTEKVKAIIINSPSNPTGSVYSKQELLEIGNWAVQHNIYLIVDDIYEKLVYNGTVFTSMIDLSDEIRRHTILINGVSKAYAMTGWRIGYVLANRKLIQAMGKIMSQSTSNPTAVSQYASIEALSGNQQIVEEMRLEYENRLNTIFPLIQTLPGVKVQKPQGAFYLYLDVSETMEKTGYTELSDFVDALVEEAHVSVVTGEAFGTNHHIRLSYALQCEKMIEAIERMKQFIDCKIID